ncbi:MAG TPA: hypothetical protein VH518_24315 [Tepidisphaeraceae bacterium]|jgi:hypothetical protein
MVLQELVRLLPSDPGTMGLIIALAGSALGVAMWLAGSRFSKPVITLLTVLIGATIGMHLPQWFGWEISGAGPAVGAALVLGVTGYALHGVWVGIGLGAVLASWTALACWIAFHNGAVWTWPTVTPETTVFQFLQAVWQTLPPDVSRILPYACATAMVTGMGLMIIWPKASLVFGWSMAGVTMITCMGLAALVFGQPQWLGKLPQPMWAQTSLLAMLVMLGALIQWKIAPKPVTSGASGGRKKSKARDDDAEDFDE